VSRDRKYVLRATASHKTCRESFLWFLLHPCISSVVFAVPGKGALSLQLPLSPLLRNCASRSQPRGHYEFLDRISQPICVLRLSKRLLQPSFSMAFRVCNSWRGLLAGLARKFAGSFCTESRPLCRILWRLPRCKPSSSSQSAHGQSGLTLPLLSTKRSYALRTNLFKVFWCFRTGTSLFFRQIFLFYLPLLTALFDVNFKTPCAVLSSTEEVMQKTNTICNKLVQQASEWHLSWCWS